LERYTGQEGGAGPDVLGFPVNDFRGQEPGPDGRPRPGACEPALCHPRRPVPGSGSIDLGGIREMAWCRTLSSD